MKLHERPEFWYGLAFVSYIISGAALLAAGLDLLR